MLLRVTPRLSLSLSLYIYIVRAKPGGRRGGGDLPPGPPKKSINISSIILYNTINAFTNYINKWLINRMVF